MKRENGFYWCKWQGEWEVCEWCNGTNWYVPGLDFMEYRGNDDDFDEIDERRIINPNI